jgi:TonB family protein
MLLSGCSGPVENHLLEMKITVFAIERNDGSLAFPMLTGEIDSLESLSNIYDAERYYEKLSSLYEFKSFRFVQSSLIDTLLQVSRSRLSPLRMFRSELPNGVIDVELNAIDPEGVQLAITRIASTDTLRYPAQVSTGRSFSVGILSDSTGRQGVLLVLSASTFTYDANVTMSQLEDYLNRKNLRRGGPFSIEKPFLRSDQRFVDWVFGSGKNQLDPKRMADQGSKSGLEAREEQIQFDVPPAPVGGMGALLGSIRYPVSAVNDGLEGSVFVKLYIDSTGRISTCRVFRGVRSDLDSAAVAGLDSALFTPAMSKGVPVGAWVMVPVQFRLDTKSDP